MPLLIRTNQYIDFYLVTLNIVPPIICVENYPNKNSIISYLRISFLSSLSADTQSYTKSLNNASNVIYKVKSYFPQPVQGAGRTKYHFVLLLRKLDCCILQRLEHGLRFLLVRSTLFFLNDF